MTELAADKKYEIDLVSLKEGHPVEYAYKIGKEFFESKGYADILAADVDVVLSVEKRHGGYMFEFDLDGTLTVACDRCLEPVTLPVATSYDIMVRHGEDYDDSRDDVLVIPESWTRLDVSGIIYDTLLLELPVRAVHPDGEYNPEMLERMN